MASSVNTVCPSMRSVCGVSSAFDCKERVCLAGCNVYMIWRDGARHSDRLGSEGSIGYIAAIILRLQSAQEASRLLIVATNRCASHVDFYALLTMT